jgi:hypothetical protein
MEPHRYAAQQPPWAGDALSTPNGATAAHVASWGAERAGRLHRQAAAVTAVAEVILDRYSTGQARQEQQHELAARLRGAATALAPGWLGAPLDAMPVTTLLGDRATAGFLRVGEARPLDDARFPVVLPLLGAGHLAIDADARDPRVGGLLRSLVLRLLAAAAGGWLRIMAVDGVGTFSPFHGAGPGLSWAPPGPEGLRAALNRAEARVRQPRHDGTFLLLVITSLPELTEAADLVRIASLASIGPATGLHLIVAGWPPPPLSPEWTRAPLAQCTQITVRNPYACVGDPPRATFTAAPGTGGMLNAPVYLDPDPPADLVRQVCAQLSASPAAMRPAPQQPPTRQPAADAAWPEYLGAAQRLDAVHRSTGDDAVNAAKRELATLGHRLAYQRHRLVRAGTDVTPSPAELEAARQGLTDLERISAALTSAWAAAESADTVLDAESGPVSGGSIAPVSPLPQAEGASARQRTPAGPMSPDGEPTGAGHAGVYIGLALFALLIATMLISMR